MLADALLAGLLVFIALQAYFISNNLNKLHEDVIAGLRNIEKAVTNRSSN